NVGKAIFFVAGCPEGNQARHSAEYRYLPDAGTFGCASHPQARAALVEELTTLAARVPFVVPPTPEMPEQLEEAPRPRPVPPLPATRDDWDFLLPRDPTKDPEPRSTPTAPGTVVEPLTQPGELGLPRKVEKNR